MKSPFAIGRWSRQWPIAAALIAGLLGAGCGGSWYAPKGAHPAGDARWVARKLDARLDATDEMRDRIRRNMAGGKRCEEVGHDPVKAAEWQDESRVLLVRCQSGDLDHPKYQLRFYRSGASMTAECLVLLNASQPDPSIDSCDTLLGELTQERD